MGSEDSGMSDIRDDAEWMGIRRLALSRCYLHRQLHFVQTLLHISTGRDLGVTPTPHVRIGRQSSATTHPTCCIVTDSSCPRSSLDAEPGVAASETAAQRVLHLLSPDLPQRVCRVTARRGYGEYTQPYVLRVIPGYEHPEVSRVIAETLARAHRVNTCPGEQRVREY